MADRIILKLFQVIPDNYQRQPEVEHERKILINPWKNGIKVLQVRYKQHDQTNHK